MLAKGGPDNHYIDNFIMFRYHLCYLQLICLCKAHICLLKLIIWWDAWLQKYKHGTLRSFAILIKHKLRLGMKLIIITSWQWKRFLHCLPSCEEKPPLIDGPPYKRPVRRSLDIFVDVSLNKQLNTQSNYRWLGTSWQSCDVTLMWGSVAKVSLKWELIWIRFAYFLTGLVWDTSFEIV